MKKTLLLILLSLIFLPLSAQTERMTINNGWLFHQGDSQNAEKVGTDCSDWEKVNIPHSWNLDAYTVKNYYQGIGWYRRTLTIPEQWRGKRLYLRVDGANKSSVIYINGQKVGAHAGGYTAYTYDITDCVDPQGANLLAISVDNKTEDVAPTSADFTFMGGIYRDVWLIAAPEQHFTLTNLGSDGVFVTPHDVSAEKAGVNVKGTVMNEGNATSKLLVVSTLISPDGKTVGSTQAKLTAAAGQALDFSIELPAVNSPELWSPDSPKLYTVRTEIQDAKTKKTIDERSTTTGMRWFSLDPDKGFFLNGEPLKLNGICRHQDQYPFGYALSDDAHRRDMRLAKEMGANFIRISHYPQDDAILEQCDRLGILAWEEIPIVNIVPDNQAYYDNSEQNVREMIRQHYNHTSVITWGYMNEVMLMGGRIAAPGTPQREALEKRTVELSERLAAVVREEDPSRVVCMAFQQDDSYLNMNMQKDLDLLGWNVYAGWYGNKMSDFEDYMESRHKATPNHAVMVSEYGAGADDRIHSLFPERFDFTSEYQQRYIEHYLKVIAETPYIIGGAYWNLIDFSSATREESMPRINNKGIVRNDRTPKDVFYLFQAAWRKDMPMVHIATRDWNRRIGFSNELQPVKVYSNLDKAMLIVNGEKQEIKNVQDWKAEWGVKLQPGRNIIECIAQDKTQQAYDVFTIDYKCMDDALKGDIDLAVNVGSNHSYYETSSDVIWLADQPYSAGRGWGYTGGERKIATSEIHETAEGPLFQTWQEGIEAYTFDVPAGEYELELLFADHSRQNASVIYMLTGDDAKKTNASAMDICVNGNVIEKDFSPAAESGALTAVRRRYVVKVGDEGLKLDFNSEGGKTFLGAIKLRSL